MKLSRLGHLLVASFCITLLLLLPQKAWAPSFDAGGDQMQQSPLRDFGQDSNSQSQSPQEKLQTQAQINFETEFAEAQAADRDRIFVDNLSVLTAEFAIQTLSEWTRPDSGLDSQPGKDELISIGGYDNVSFRIPHSFDNGGITRYVVDHLIEPYLRLPFDRKRLKIVSFVGNRITQNEFQKSIPTAYQADDGAMTVIRRNRRDQPEGLQDLLASYANSTLVVIGHIETQSSAPFIEVTDDQQPDRSYLLSVDYFQKSAEANNITLILLGCGTGSFSAIGTNSPSGKISSMDAVRNAAAAINGDISTIGALLTGLAGQHYDLTLSWTSSLSAYKAIHGEDAVIPFDFTPRNPFGVTPLAQNASSNFVSQGATTDGSPIVSATTNPVIYEISLAFGHWLHLLAIPSFFVGVIFTIFGFVALFAAAIFTVPLLFMLLPSITDQESVGEIPLLFLTIVALAVAGTVLKLLGRGLDANLAGALDIAPDPSDLILDNFVISVAFVAACLLPWWLFIKRTKTRIVLNVDLFCTFGACWLMLAPIFSAGPIQLMASSGILDQRYLNVGIADKLPPPVPTDRINLYVLP